jgi:SagB-type dehydrogenase family enzyme
MKEGIGYRFMKETTGGDLSPSDQSMGLPQPLLELPYDGKGRIIRLPNPDSLAVPDLDLWTAINIRTTSREYTSTPLTLDELSYLLWTTQGIKGIVNGEYTVRTVPSAGARHAIETNLLLNRVEGVTPGLYRYLARDHQILEISTDPDLLNEVSIACYDQPFIRTSAVTFLWTAVVYRMTWRYGERGYRYLLLDAGHICQNLYLAAEAIEAGVCAIGAFDDDQMNRLLGLDGTEQSVIYAATIGKRS